MMVYVISAKRTGFKVYCGIYTVHQLLRNTRTTHENHTDRTFALDISMCEIWSL